jgi:hypothetical protein
MEVALVLRIVGLRISANDIRECSIVIHERTGRIFPRSNHSVEIEERFVPRLPGWSRVATLI